MNSRVVVAHKENVNDVLNIIMAHPTESPLPGEPNPFTSFNSEVVCTGDGACQGDSVSRNAYIKVEAKHGRGSVMREKIDVRGGKSLVSL